MEVFNRVEQKYILNEDEYKILFKKIESHLEKDYYYKSKICNLYFDNENDDLIVNSLEKPIFKEKVRLRSYNVPNINDTVYLELKGKFNGIVFKRRLEIILSDFYKYLETGIIEEKYNNQVMKEIDYTIKKFKLKPKIFIGYDRLSYYDKDNINFRVTFDANLRSRVDELNLELGDNGNLFNKKMYIMEVKSLSSIPLWFTRVLSEMKIYPNSFSKYGEIYKKQTLKNERKKKNKKIIINNELEENLNLSYMEGKLYV
ncbi:MAG: polyphosphate polymerase domain-containing protein [Bacilli bacterium]|nr:polyphosphate polymerase domain-containing protein [Bacilli bacterium]